MNLGGGGEETYVVSLTRVLKLVEYLVEGLLERAHKPIRILKHFMYRHWKAKVYIPQEVPTPLPRCTECGIHIPRIRLDRHKQTDICD